MRPPFIDEVELRERLSIEAAVSALEHTFTDQEIESPPRQHLGVGEGDLLLMPAWSGAAAGVKVVTVAPENPRRGLPLIHGVYVLFAKPSLEPIAVFDAAPLTALRTAAVSGLATKHLARAEASHLVVFGTGVQARAHIETMRAVRPIESVTIVSRTASHADRLASEISEHALDALVGRPEDVAGADIVCTCTTSTSPLFPGDLVEEGTHVNAVGSYKPDARELDDALVGRAQIVVDTEVALRESGDLAIPIAKGILDEARVTTLGTLLTQPRARAAPDVTVFKSVGAAFEDLAVAAAAASV